MYLGEKAKDTYLDVAGQRAVRQFWQMRRTKIPTQKSKPVNASYLHHWKPTPKVRMKHGSKRGQKLKFCLGIPSGVILILAAGLDSVGRRPVNKGRARRPKIQNTVCGMFSPYKSYASSY